MAIKVLDPADRLIFPADRGGGPAELPGISCDRARRDFAALQETGALRPFLLVLLANHLVDTRSTHAVDCPFHTHPGAGVVLAAGLLALLGDAEA